MGLIKHNSIDKYTNQNQNLLAQQMYKKRFGYIRKALNGYKFKTVLDAACGNGQLGRLAKDEWGVDIYGAEIEKKEVMRARGLGIKAKVADLSKKIPFDDKSFDMILSSESIEHFVNPDKFLREAHRVLKPKAIIVIDTPNLSSWLNRILFLFGIYPIALEASTEKLVGLGILSGFTSGNRVIGHVHLFNYPALRDILSYHGFKIEKAIGMGMDYNSPRLPLITKIYRIVDSLFTAVIPLSSNYVVVARKTK